MPILSVKLRNVSKNPFVRHVFTLKGIVPTNDVMVLLDRQDAVEDILPVRTLVKREIMLFERLIAYGQHDDAVAPIAQHGPHAPSDRCTDVHALLGKLTLDVCVYPFFLHDAKMPFAAKLSTIR